IYFLFHAEDGIRYRNVTGVQTCALPISGCCAQAALPNTALLTDAVSSAVQCSVELPERSTPRASIQLLQDLLFSGESTVFDRSRSEERRVGNECRSAS